MPRSKITQVFLMPRNAILRFDSSMIWIAALSLLNFLYKIRFSGGTVKAAENLWNPTWLLFGPLLYFAYCSISEKPRLREPKLWIHLVPFAVFFIFYLAALMTTRTENVWLNPVYTWYQNSFFVISISLIAYAVYGFSERKHINTEESRGEVFIFLSGFLLLDGVLGIFMYFSWGLLHINMGIDYRLFAYFMLVIIGAFIIRYFMLIKRDEEEQPEKEASYSNSGLHPDQVSKYIEKLNTYFSDTESFINPNLSLEILSKDLDIPKYHFSQLFNHYLGKNFYNYVAALRINYALERLQEEKGKLKIESLSYECGFNSKTAFNRHFKLITGITPLQYITKEGYDNSSSVNESVN